MRPIRTAAQQAEEAELTRQLLAEERVDVADRIAVEEEDTPEIKNFVMPTPPSTG